MQLGRSPSPTREGFAVSTSNSSEPKFCLKTCAETCPLPSRILRLHKELMDLEETLQVFQWTKALEEIRDRGFILGV